MRRRRFWPGAWGKKARSSFLKKRTKKLLLVAGLGRSVATPPANKSFFASFFAKKEALTFPRSTP
jgi:hypothetical protein